MEPIHRGGGRFGWEEFSLLDQGLRRSGLRFWATRKIIANATKWLKAAMANPTRGRLFRARASLLTALDGGKADLWPQMPVLNALQSYYEYTGDKQGHRRDDQVFSLGRFDPGGRSFKRRVLAARPA